MGAITISAVSGALGGMVENIDLSQPLRAPTLIELRQALAEYEVLFFRNQEMSLRSFAASEALRSAAVA